VLDEAVRGEETISTVQSDPVINKRNRAEDQENDSNSAQKDSKG
jgi:hypothetical protein